MVATKLRGAVCLASGLASSRRLTERLEEATVCLVEQTENWFQGSAHVIVSNSKYCSLLFVKMTDDQNSKKI